MATILLSAAGAAAGAVLGPLGAIAGRALGAAAGYLIDQSLIRLTQPDTVGPRLGAVDLQTSTEGRALGRVYGRARIAGQIIWATRYVEVAETERGGKGGPSVTSYSYLANFAVGLCEGPLSHVGRVFADGVALDTTAITMRVHLGHADQPADSLILAKQNGCPAYRDTAYVVFEALPLEPYGNRIPQLSFEVIRAVDTLEEKVTGVALIPGATEYGYGTAEVRRINGAGATVSENRHVLTAETDLIASLDELQALCPNLRRVALVIAWFGTDLSAGQCRIRPGVEHRDKATDTAWSVAGLTRTGAHLVSRVDGNPAFGGTPSDATVLQAIAEMKARGLEVLLYPFLLMDIPAGNAAGQPAYPWRGRIRAERATAAAEIAAFVGTATSDGFRRFIRHHAKLAATGGADGLLLGSELVGLTTSRDAAGDYPFVEALVALAAEARGLAGPACQLSYGADWSEYFGHQPGDGSGDVRFHLDPFWASPDVDFVGIDYYLPLSDWRHGPHLDETMADTGDDPAYLAANLNGGEYFDWYYADDAARRMQLRAPISDGAYSKPWVFRPKDLAGWWGNLHYDRSGGVEAATPTAWRPGMKPIRLTEVGAPAVDLAATKPNAFPDARSSEGTLPPAARGARDDLAQRRYNEAVLDGFAGSAMVAASYLWAWDARPFPAFPQATDTWADGGNWATGHWLNGRLGGASVAGLIRAVLKDYGFHAVETAAVAGHVDGFVIDDRMSARAALEPLIAAFLIDALDTGTAIRCAGRQRRPAVALDVDDLADEATRLERVRGEAAALPTSVSLTTSDALADFRRSTVTARLGDGADGRAASADLAVVLPAPAAAALAEIWLRDARAGREALRFGLGPRHLALEPGDIVTLPDGEATKTLLIERLADGIGRRVESRSHDPGLYTPLDAGRRAAAATLPATTGAPAVVIVDIARATASEAQRPLIAATATPWPGSVSVYRQTAGGGLTPLATLARRAVTGTLQAELAIAPAGLWDRGNVLDVVLDAGSLAALPEAAVLAGGNAAVVERAGGGWEVLQFASATLVAANRWRLTNLLRGQRGSHDDGARPAPAGGRFVLLNDATVPLPVSLGDLGQTVRMKVGPAGALLGGGGFAEVEAVVGGRGLVPFAPVHLNAVRDAATGAIAFSWRRRSRADGAESWTLADAPLDEAAERYRVEVLDGGTVRRAVTVDTPAWTYGAAEQAADFGAAVAACTLRVAQVGALVGAGFALTATPVPAVA